MSDILEESSANFSNSSLYETLKNCAQLQSYESLQGPIQDFSYSSNIWENYECKMISTNYMISNTSTGSYNTDDSYADNILEENGRISLAYENLQTIPKKFAERFAAQTKILDLCYNNFQNLSFLTFFDNLHTLILDRNIQLDSSSLPYLPYIEILWINNCNILKISDWIHRIQIQCPAIRHLSIMGNPGTKNVLDYTSSPLHSDCFPNTPTPIFMDYRNYVFGMLPNLIYLDGGARHRNFEKYKEIFSTSSQTNGSSSILDNKDHYIHCAPCSPSFSFRNLFHIRTRKKSYQSSSTN